MSLSALTRGIIGLQVRYYMAGAADRAMHKLGWSFKGSKPGASGRKTADYRLALEPDEVKHGQAVTISQAATDLAWKTVHYYLTKLERPMRNGFLLREGADTLAGIFARLLTQKEVKQAIVRPGVTQIAVEHIAIPVGDDMVCNFNGVRTIVGEKLLGMPVEYAVSLFDAVLYRYLQAKSPADDKSPSVSIAAKFDEFGVALDITVQDSRFQIAG